MTRFHSEPPLGVEGKILEEGEKMLGSVDHSLSLPKGEKNNFRLGRRAGVYQSVEGLSKPERRIQVERALQQIETERPEGIKKVLSDLMESFL
jgi:hypothetical protein